jgi:hypothetical protein
VYQIESLAVYVDLLQENSGEAQALFSRFADLRHELFPRSSSLGNPLRTSDPIYFREVRKFAGFHTA